MPVVKKLPFVKGREIVPAIWVRQGKRTAQLETLLPEDVLGWLK